MRQSATCLYGGIRPRTQAEDNFLHLFLHRNDICHSLYNRIVAAVMAARN